MIHLLSGWWGQIWPNLLASVIWATPALLWHHRSLKRHVTAEVERTTADRS